MTILSKLSISNDRTVMIITPAKKNTRQRIPKSDNPCRSKIFENWIQARPGPRGGPAKSLS